MQVSLSWTGTTAIHLFHQIDHLKPLAVSPCWNGSEQANIIWYAQSFNHCLSNSIYKCFTNNLWVFMASLGLVRTIAVARTHVISQMEKFQLHELKLRWFSPHYKHLQDWGNFNVCISFQEYHATTATSRILSSKICKGFIRVKCWKVWSKQEQRNKANSRLKWIIQAQRVVGKNSKLVVFK